MTHAKTRSFYSEAIAYQLLGIVEAFTPPPRGRACPYSSLRSRHFRPAISITPPPALLILPPPSIPAHPHKTPVNRTSCAQNCQRLIISYPLTPPGKSTFPSLENWGCPQNGSDGSLCAARSPVLWLSAPISPPRPATNRSRASLIPVGVPDNPASHAGADRRNSGGGKRRNEAGTAVSKFRRVASFHSRRVGR